MASLAVFAPSPLFRAGLAALVGSLGFDPVEEAADLRDLARRDRDAAPPELVLIALPKGHSDPGASMQQIRAWSPQTKVVFIAPSLDPQTLSACFAAGASGYLLETMSREGLRHSLRLVSAGERVFPSELASLLTSASARMGMADATGELRGASEREVDILRYVAKGETNSLIAKRLGITDGEVGANIKKILRRLRVSNRTQAALWAVAHGLSEPGSAADEPGDLEDDAPEGLNLH